MKIDFAESTQKRQKNYQNELLETPVKIFICFADIYWVVRAGLAHNKKFMESAEMSRKNSVKTDLSILERKDGFWLKANRFKWLR